MIRLLASLLAGALLLTGCSVGNNVATPGLALTEAIEGVARARAAARQAGPNTAITVTRADLEGISDPLIRVSIENRKIVSFLYVKQDRPPYRIWFSPDNSSVIMRGGLATGSRGIGADLYSVDAPQMAAVLEGRGKPGPARRINRAFNGVSVVVDQEFDCVIADKGAQTITILQVNHPVRYITETCTGALESFENEYWLGGGTVWLSRQWFGKDLGYIRFERLIRG